MGFWKRLEKVKFLLLVMVNLENDTPILYSTCKAEKVAGGYVFTGHKMFVSLTTVWDYLGFHGQDNSDPDNPEVVPCCQFG